MEQVEVRLLQPGEYPAAVALSDVTFRDVSQKSMGSAFPAIFSPALSQCFGTFVDGKLAAFMGLVPSVVHVGPSRLMVYSLGSVCTHPNYQGKGYASMLLAQVQNFIRQANAALLLVSGERSLYTRANCFAFGQVSEITLEADSDAITAAETDIVIRKLESRDWLTVHALASGRAVRYEQGVWEMATLVESEAHASCVHLRHKALVAERDGELVAFAILALPERENQPGLAVEWGGDAQGVAAICRFATATSGLARLVAHVPWHETDLIEQLTQGPHQSKQAHNQGTLYVTDVSLLLTQMKAYLAEKDPVLSAQLAVETDEQGAYHLTLGTEKVVLGAEDLISFFFNPTWEATKASDEMGRLRQKLFPLPFPYTAGLNYV